MQLRRHQFYNVFNTKNFSHIVSIKVASYSACYMTNGDYIKSLFQKPKNGSKVLAAVKNWKLFAFSFNSKKGGCIVILQNVSMYVPLIFHVFQKISLHVSICPNTSYPNFGVKYEVKCVLPRRRRRLEQSASFELYPKPLIFLMIIEAKSSFTPKSVPFGLLGTCEIENFIEKYLMH